MVGVNTVCEQASTDHCIRPLDEHEDKVLPEDMLPFLRRHNLVWRCVCTYQGRRVPTLFNNAADGTVTVSCGKAIGGCGFNCK
jgi:hypothetical protein